MNTPKPMFVREVARIDDPRFVSGQVAGHRARRLIDAPDAAFAEGSPRSGIAKTIELTPVG